MAPPNQTELLSSTKLKLNDSVRRSTAQPDRVLLRTAGGERRLVLTPAQATIVTPAAAPIVSTAAAAPVAAPAAAPEHEATAAQVAA